MDECIDYKGSKIARDVELWEFNFAKGKVSHLYERDWEMERESQSLIGIFDSLTDL